MRVEDKKLQVRATEDAMARTAMSRRKSCFEGNKLWDGSNNDAIELGED